MQLPLKFLEIVHWLPRATPFQQELLQFGYSGDLLFFLVFFPLWKPIYEMMSWA